MSTNTKRRTEMLFCLTNQAHRHVWVPAEVTAEDQAHDPDVTAEENGAVVCLRTYGMTCAPTAVRDQFHGLVTRQVAK